MSSKIRIQNEMKKKDRTPSPFLRAREDSRRGTSAVSYIYSVSSVAGSNVVPHGTRILCSRKHVSFNDDHNSLWVIADLERTGHSLWSCADVWDCQANLSRGDFILSVHGNSTAYNCTRILYAVEALMSTFQLSAHSKYASSCSLRAA